MYMIIILLALAVSMDAFSLSLIYGITFSSKNKRIFLSIMVGVFHYLMPLFGKKVGFQLFNLIDIGNQIISFSLYMILGISMIFEKEEIRNEKFSIKDYLIFPLAVSIDSFSIGISLYDVNSLFLCITFMLFSAFLTYLGLNIGESISSICPENVKKIGGLIFISAAIFSIF